MVLIDGDRLADSIHRELCGHITCDNCPFRTEDGGCEVEAWLDNAPVVEPKQGRWIDCKDPTTIGYECSECGKYCAEVEFIPECDFMSPVWNYCPNCGSRNRKENE